MFDIALVCVLILFAVRGFAHGFVREVFSILGVVLAAILGFLFVDVAATVIEGVLGTSAQVARVAGFLVLFLALSAGFYFLGTVLSKLVKLMLLRPVDKAAGVFVGLLEGIVVMGVVLAAMSSFVGVHRALEKSVVARFITDVFSAIFSGLAS